MIIEKIPEGEEVEFNIEDVLLEALHKFEELFEMIVEDKEAFEKAWEINGMLSEALDELWQV